MESHPVQDAFPIQTSISNGFPSQPRFYGTGGFACRFAQHFASGQDDQIRPRLPSGPHDHRQYFHQHVWAQRDWDDRDEQCDSGSDQDPIKSTMGLPKN